MESMKQKFFRAAVPLVMLAVSAALSVFVYRLPQPVREAAAKIYCEQALQGMGLTVDEVKLTQLPSGQASVEVWLTYQDEKQALEVRI